MSKKTDEFIITNDDGSVTITLSRALDVNGAQLSTLTMREPTVNDQLVAAESKGSDAAKEIIFFANLCEIPPADIRRLTIRDYARVQLAFAGFTD